MDKTICQCSAVLYIHWDEGPYSVVCPHCRTLINESGKPACIVCRHTLNGEGICIDCRTDREDKGIFVKGERGPYVFAEAGES